MSQRDSSSPNHRQNRLTGRARRGAAGRARSQTRTRLSNTRLTDVAFCCDDTRRLVQAVADAVGAEVRQVIDPTDDEHGRLHVAHSQQVDFGGLVVLCLRGDAHPDQADDEDDDQDFLDFPFSIFWQ